MGLVREWLARIREKKSTYWFQLSVFLLIVGIMLGNKGFRGLLRNYTERKKLSSEWSRLKKEEADLAYRIHSFQNQDAYLEKIARQELGFVKKGELEYRFNSNP
ncbi:MAG: septum formation initiator family protein [Elusimicrobia bacterium]|nr:septum formation initiator family protein [Elusimicrobiota bacterium]